jgi:hypothetical protein
VRVRAHKNLHNGLWSVLNPSTGLLLRHVEEVELADVRFHVSETGRARVLRLQKRNVHAYALGTLVYLGKSRARSHRGWRRFTYNPYRAAHFVTVPSDTPVLTAGRVLLDRAGAWFR